MLLRSFSQNIPTVSESCGFQGSLVILVEYRHVSFSLSLSHTHTHSLSLPRSCSQQRNAVNQRCGEMVCAGCCLPLGAKRRVTVMHNLLLQEISARILPTPSKSRAILCVCVWAIFALLYWWRLLVFGGGLKGFL